MTLHEKRTLMLSLGAMRYYLFPEPTDMRQRFDGLCGLVNGRLGQNPVYLFQQAAQPGQAVALGNGRVCTVFQAPRTWDF